MKAATKKGVAPSKKKPALPTIAISDTVKAFAQLVKNLSYESGTSAPSPTGLTNFTFWAGAGFSKSWEPTAPVGNDLFTLGEDNFAGDAIEFMDFTRMFGIEDSDDLQPEQLRQIVYEIDMQEKYPDVRSRYFDQQNLRLLRAALRSAVVNRYEQVSTLNYSVAGKFHMPTATQRQLDILALFRHLLLRADGSQDLVEGIRFQFVTTNYDFVIESILDNILGPDDSLHQYTYRGFTPAAVAGEPNPAPLHDHWLAWHFLKINGGFEILRNGRDYILHYDERDSATIIANPPILMLPSREQDYTDPYFQEIFPKAVRLLRETKVLILVGYSLPADDALFRFIIRQFAEAKEDGHGKYIFYIDPCEEKEKRNRLEAIFPAIFTVNAPKVYRYNQGFDAFAAEYCAHVPTSGK